MKTYTDLKKELKNEPLYPLYILTGEEVVVLKEYRKMICKKENRIVEWGESLKGVMNRVMAESMDAKSYIYIIRDDEEVKKEEKIWMGLLSGGIQGNNTIILLYDALDKRGKFYKALADRVFVFERLGIPILTKLILERIDISPNYAEKLALVCGCDYGRVCTEINKIRLYSYPENSFSEGLKYLVNSGHIYQSVGNMLFDFVDAFCANKPKLAYSLWQDLDPTRDTLGALSLIYNKLRKVYLLQEAKKEDEDIRDLGIEPKQMYIIQKSVGVFSSTRLLFILQVIQDIESGIKKGKYQEDKAVDFLMIKVFV